MAQERENVPTSRRQLLRMSTGTLGIGALTTGVTATPRRHAVQDQSSAATQVPEVSMGVHPNTPEAESKHAIIFGVGEELAGREWESFWIMHRRNLPLVGPTDSCYGPLIDLPAGDGYDVEDVDGDTLELGVDRGGNNDSLVVDEELETGLPRGTGTFELRQNCLGTIIGDRPTLNHGDQLVIVYPDVINPSTADEYETEITINTRYFGGGGDDAVETVTTAIGDSVSDWYEGGSISVTDEVDDGSGRGDDTGGDGGETGDNGDDTTGEAAVTVAITETNAPLNAGEQFQLVAAAQNSGSVETTQTIRLIIGHSPEQVDSTTVTLAPNETQTVTLGYETYPAKQTTEFPVRVESENDAVEKSITVYGTEDRGRNRDRTPVAVAIQETNAPLNAGEQFQLTATARNTGNTEVSETIRLIVGHSLEQVDSQTVTLAPGESQTVTLGYETYPAKQTTEFPVRVESSADTAEQSITVYGTG